jgi:hypothetical protein
LPAAIGSFQTPALDASSWAASKSSPDVRAAPAGLWQWAQLASSQARARWATVPVDGSFQTAMRGACVGCGAPSKMPILVQCSSWFSGPVAYSNVRLSPRAVGPIGCMTLAFSWQPMHWFVFGTL